MTRSQPFGRLRSAAGWQRSRLALFSAYVALSLGGTREAEATPSVHGIERAAATKRDIEVDPTLTPLVDGCVRARSVVEIDAPPDVVKDAIFDFQARTRESWLVDSVEVYRIETNDEVTHRRAKWTLSVLGVDIVYHTAYTWDPSRSEIVWDLDEDRHNDLNRALGCYQLAPGPQPDTTTVTYIFEIGTRHRISQGIRRRLTVRSVRELLDSIRTRSERAANE
jgi:hypothetical protein